MRTSVARSAVEPAVAAPAKAEVASAAAVQVAEGGSEPVSSPARVLQARLESGYADAWDLEAAGAKGRWPLYVALPFWAGVSALMWVGIIALVWTVSRHF